MAVATECGGEDIPGGRLGVLRLLQAGVVVRPAELGRQLAQLGDGGGGEGAGRGGGWLGGRVREHSAARSLGSNQPNLDKI